MFSQFRNAVESFSNPHPVRPSASRSGSQDLSANQAAELSPRGSLDLTGVTKSISLSTGQLAESALSNLRKSLATQRSAGTAPPSEQPSPQPEKELRPIHKSTLEERLQERLRASFTIGEGSAATSETNSHVPSPAPLSVNTQRDAAKPASIPLPLSPPLQSPIQSNIIAPEPISLSALHAVEQNLLGAEAGELIDRVSESTLEPRYTEADIPLPPSPSVLPVTIELEGIVEQPASPAGESPERKDVKVEMLRDQLQLLEQRFTDVTNSFKRLQAEKDAADQVLHELTPVSSIADASALREHLHRSSENGEEIQRLTNRIRTYDERIEELRDTHRLESRSQSEQISHLRKQVEEAEALLSHAQSTNTKAEDDVKQQKVEIDQMRANVDKANGLAKEEEEKRVKAISLLKTVRQKLVKAEKERDDTVKEVQDLKNKDREEREKEKTERARLEAEIESTRTEKERDITGLRIHFDQELSAMKDRLEKEYAARKGQFELEAFALKNVHQKEIAQKNSRISTLEISVRALSHEKDNLFDQLQLRQAEVESVHSQLEVVQNNTAELQFQLHESSERVGLLTEELDEARRAQEYRTQRPPPSPDKTPGLLSAMEKKYEAKVAELRSQLAVAENERNEAEVALNRSLQQKIHEVETLRSSADRSSQTRKEKEDEVSRLKQDVDKVTQEVDFYKRRAEDAEKYSEGFRELEATLKKQSETSVTRIAQYEKQLQEAKERETQLRASIKGLREELRKVQASAALLERQRNPGVGYWSSMTATESTSDFRSASPSSSVAGSVMDSPGAKSPSSKADEEVNLEYLRNVILQFLEHKEMRAHLVRVLSIILHFTPQETRRLVAKV